MPQAEHRAAVPETLENTLRKLLVDVVREQIPLIAQAVVAAIQTNAAPGPPPAGQTSQYVTVAEAAAQVGVAVKTVRRWIRSGKLRAVTPGRRLRVERGDLERFISAAANEGGTTDTEAVAANLLAKRKR